MNTYDQQNCFEIVNQHQGKVKAINEFLESWPTTKGTLGVISITTKIKKGHEYHGVPLKNIAMIIGDAFEAREDNEADIVFDFIFDSDGAMDEPTVKMTYRGELFDSMAFSFENPAEIPTTLNYYDNHMNVLQICCHDGERPIFWLRSERKPFSF